MTKIKYLSSTGIITMQQEQSFKLVVDNASLHANVFTAFKFSAL